MHDLDSLRTLLLAMPGAEESFPFDAVTLVAKVGGKMFALLATTGTPLRLSLKVDPDYGEVLRATFPAIQPGYYLNKRHWVTLTLDGSLDPALVQELIDGSYQLVVRGLPRAVREQLAAGDGGA
ncbi:MmcQ/YjbR family DNA-binding protein [Candidatus Oscillochloris fontis]|uniref:MmcQ/YjbR family DNA-binding protein n=1 Tax=Candidatus Oscillochloris fontis TaxID=2496868 RepID=UPI00101DF865|nr:MmcQ/YjbR family DNA-binding protein [Candidatus Oscillochloris fontis]